MISPSRVRTSFLALFGVAMLVFGRAETSRADFTFSVGASPPEIVSEGASARFFFAIDVVSTNESLLVSSITPGFSYDSGPDPLDGPIDFSLGGAVQPGDTLKAPGFYSFEVKVFTSPFDGPDGDNGTYDASKWKVFAAVTLLGLNSLNSVTESRTTFITIKDARFDPTPEPSSCLLLGLGIAGVAGYGVRRNRSDSLHR
jgi:hypothetical protein